MKNQKNVIAAVSILVLFSLKLSGATYFESWSVTEIEELKLKHTWMIHHFGLISLPNKYNNLYSQRFGPPGNENFKWYIRLETNSSDNSYMGLFLRYLKSDIVRVNYSLSIGSLKAQSADIFEPYEEKGWSTFIKREQAFNSRLSNGTLVIDCEIRMLTEIISPPGSIEENQFPTITNRTLRTETRTDFLIDAELSDVDIDAGNESGANGNSVLMSLLFKNDTANNEDNGKLDFRDANDVEPDVV